MRDLGEFAFAPALLGVAVGVLLLLLEQRRGQGRGEDQRDEHRQDHRRHHRQRELPVDHAGRSAEERHRQEHRRQYQRDRDQRDGNLVHRFDRRLPRRHLGIFFHQALDVLDHDDRVVDQQADRENEPEQRQRVDREAGEIEHAERAEQHDRDRDRRDQRRAPALQEHEHYDDDEDDGLDERLDDLVDRQLDEVGGVVGVGEFQAGREALGGFCDESLDQLGGLERVGAGREQHRDTGAGMRVDAAARVVVFRTQLNPGDIPQLDHGAIVGGLEDDVGELLGRLEARLCGDGRVQHLRVGLRLPTEFAGGDFGVLRLDRGRHVARDQLVARELARVQPDPHRVLRAEHVAVADARNTAERILQVRDKIVGDVLVGELVGLVIDADDQEVVRVRFADDEALLLDLLRQAGEGLLDLVLDLDLRNVGIGALLERHRDIHRAARRRGRTEVNEPVDAGQRLLDDLRHAVLDCLRVGTREGCADGHLRRRDVGVLRDRQAHDRTDAAEHHDDREHPGEDRAIDKDTG